MQDGGRLIILACCKFKIIKSFIMYNKQIFLIVIGTFYSTQFTSSGNSKELLFVLDVHLNEDDRFFSSDNKSIDNFYVIFLCN